ncbi:guanylate-binding protein, N-terminal domain-containing protein [Toxoplasma gondii ME49]|uniref:Guanylate binding protein, putative n=5 Tax=Toxoplasma gondii TaxID=5811 RepID=B6KR20_TOXGV|nr:guanylate-binding protein, N-terminal domain-containing protein [Toxoplasma gondii ME49]EPT27352.1 guanylate-binding protein, N-terminal domain-containing protein [Toxoplasma gondii ME49]ESS29022.1 guanylate-binding protein, N-terminal domain-containing protein [Toxoplasma gondii VEG]CEL76174.1 TPA: guanylate binding protein, putative [Toxoplasma gondii VEG]|eukprot:XP_002370293.1 guanylate-binding protein, N-terminal domain-containing protein [Toxoplasma gondii ME49]
MEGLLARVTSTRRTASPAGPAGGSRIARLSPFSLCPSRLCLVFGVALLPLLITFSLPASFHFLDSDSSFPFPFVCSLLSPTPSTSSASPEGGGTVSQSPSFFLLPASASPLASAAGLAGGAVALGARQAESAEVAKASKADKGARRKKKMPPRLLQVVRPNERHTGLEIDEEALAYIEAIPAPISVVTAVGSIHTGKSFLLSQLLAFSYPHDISYDPLPDPSSTNSTLSSSSPSSRRFTAFPVGYTVHPGTQGLSVWSEPLRVDRQTGRVVVEEEKGKQRKSSVGKSEVEQVTNVLLLDTEGFGGPNVTRSYDQLLYAVASLVSSEILFTTMKMIDAQSLQLLEDLTRDANLFNLRAHAQSVNATSTLPQHSEKREPSLAAGSSKHQQSEASSGQEKRAPAEVEQSLEESFAGSALFSSLAPCCLSWVVQDFVQDLQGLTAMEWLDRLIATHRWSASPAEVEKNFWKEKRGAEKNKKPDDDGDNSLSHSLRSFYDSIHCVALPAPSSSSEALQRLDLLPVSEMTPVYRAAFQEFKDSLLRRVANNFKAKNRLLHPSTGRGIQGVCARRTGQKGESSERREDSDALCGREEGAEQRGENEHEVSGEVGTDKEVTDNRRGGVGRVAMSGKDVADLLRFLVRAANLNMFENVQIFMNHFSTVRSDLAKNDLLLLFEEDMRRFLNVHPPALPPLFFSFADSLRQRLLQQWQQQIRGQEGLHAQDIQQQQQEEMIQQLNEKVEKFRGIAEEQVRRYCREFCGKRLHQVQQEIQKQQQRLPMAPQALAEWAIYEQRLQRSLLTDEVNRGGRDFASADVCEEELRAYDEKVENLFLFLHKENTKKIAADMQKAEEQTVAFFAEQLKQHPLEMLRPLEEFRALLFEWKTGAWEIFEQKVEDLRAVRQIYSVFEQRLTTELKRLEQQSLQHWDEKCTEIASDILHKWSNTYKAEVIASFPKIQSLPVDEDILHAASQNKMQDALDEMNELYCAKTAPWQKVASQLKEVMLERQKELEMQNVEAIKTNCKEPLDKLLKKLRPEAESRYFWTTFVSLARREALAVLSSQNAQTRATVLLSERLVNRVTEHWLETDVRATYADTIWRNMVNLCEQIAGGIIGIGGLIVFSTYNIWMGVGMMAVGAWLLFGILTLIGWMRGAFKFTVQGLWHGLQDRVGLEAAVGIFFITAAIVGASGFRWFSIRKARTVAYAAGPQAYQTNPISMSRPCSVDPVAYGMAPGLSRASQSSVPQQMEFPTPLGVRSSAAPSSSMMYDSIFPDAERKSRYSTAYVG